MGVVEAGRPRAGVGATGVEDHGAQRTALEHLLGPQHRRRLDTVARDDAGSRAQRSVADDAGGVAPAGGLQARGDASGTEPSGCGDAHGATPTTGSPAVSSSPRTRLAFWIACPAAPLTRLS